jgi:hypothetical protein
VYSSRAAGSPADIHGGLLMLNVAVFTIFGSAKHENLLNFFIFMQRR